MIRLLAILTMLIVAPATVFAGDGWQLRKQDAERQIRVYLRDRSDSQYHDVYAVTHLPGSVHQVEAVLADIPAMPEWAPRVARARVLKRQDSQAWIYIDYRLPYPFKARDAVVLSQRSRDNDVVSIHSQAVPGMVRVQPDHVRLSNLQSTWRLSPLAGGQVKVELWGIAEPGGLVPAMVYNYNLADDAIQTLRQLRRMAQRSKYQDDRAAGRSPPKM